MRKKIMYCTGMFHPANEAISKEIDLLRRHFSESFVFSRSSFAELKLSRHVLTYWNRITPLDNLLKYFETKFNITHIYHVIKNDFFIKRLSKQPIILTACSEYSEIKNIISYLNKIAIIVVQSENLKEKLIQKGIHQDKLKIIYPGLELNRFKYENSFQKNDFKILFASAPLFPGNFNARGINLLFDASIELDQSTIILLWRKKSGNYVKKQLQQPTKSLNIKLINKTVNNMPDFYRQIDATVAPFTINEKHKSCPNSIIESLAAGKPVLVSDQVGISDLIAKEKCGIVFKSNKFDFLKAVEQMRENYFDYQKNTIPTAIKYFSLNKFYQEYENLYSEVLSN